MFVVLGSWFVVLGSWFVVRGSWFLVRCAWRAGGRQPNAAYFKIFFKCITIGTDFALSW
jgi:hypothetical protein